MLCIWSPNSHGELQSYVDNLVPGVIALRLTTVYRVNFEAMVKHLLPKNGR
jgi:hypothetical protein